MPKNTRVRHAFKGSWRQHKLTPFDGIYPDPDERGVLTQVGGIQLRDIVNPATGFCIGASSATFNPGAPKSRMADPTSGAGAKLPVRDDSSGRWYAPETGHVYRTTDDGDAALPRTRIIQEKPEPTPKVDSPRRAVHQQARKVTQKLRVTDTDIREYLTRTYGVKGITLTPRIRQAARAAMVHAATVKQYSADLRNATKKV